MKVPDVLVFCVCFFFPNMIVFILCIPVVHRMLWRSAGLASKKGNSNDSSLFQNCSVGLGASLSPMGDCLACFLLQEG